MEALRPHSILSTRRLRDDLQRRVDRRLMQPESVPPDPCGGDTLLANGADPNGTSSDGTPFLCLACLASDEACVQALLAYGADPCQTCAAQQTALHKTLARIDETTPALVAALLKAGVRPLARDVNGDTAFHVFMRQQDRADDPRILAAAVNTWRLVAEPFAMARDGAGNSAALAVAHLGLPCHLAVLRAWAGHGADVFAIEAAGHSVYSCVRANTTRCPHSARTARFFVQTRRAGGKPVNSQPVNSQPVNGKQTGGAAANGQGQPS